MKLRLVSFGIVTAHSLAASVIFAADAVQTPPAVKPAQAEQTAGAQTNQSIPRSVFTIPTNPTEGRNPFFPNSAGATNKPPRSAETITLALNGFGGTPEKKLVIINNRTFEEGEEGEITSGSLRAKIRCIEIKADSAVVEINGGERKELRMRSGN
jgi:hypothetical protein